MRIVRTVLFVVGMSACAGGEPAGEQEPEATGVATDTRDAAGAPSAELVATVDGLEGPEAVKYDPDQDVWFVANFGEAGDDERDGDGFISRLDADGVVESLRFVVGRGEQPLHMPRGMGLVGDTLWVADVDGVHGFHRRTGEALAFVDFRPLEPGFLNDIGIDPDGTLFVTDTGLGRVYRIDGREPVVAVEDERTGPPNGITWDESRNAFLLAPWGGGQTLRSWSPGNGFNDVATVPGGNFDGVEVMDGRIVLASQTDSTLWAVEAGAPTRVTALDGAPADIGVDPDRSRVAIPYIARDLVEIWSVPPASDQGR